MRIVSWNVNGVVSKVRKGEFGPIAALSPDVVCIQEIRTKSEPEILPGYRHIWNHAERDGFWGTATLTRRKPLRVVRELGVADIDREGRIVACEYDGLWVVNVYVPNAKGNLRRKAVRREWDEALADFVGSLAAAKPTVVCGDFNVAITDDDIYEGNPWRDEEAREGFPTDERSHLAELVDGGFVDAFRFLHPDEHDSYTWWSQRRNRRGVNRGWRLDYFLVSADVKWDIVRCEHHGEVMGSDHCPIELEVSL